MALPFLVEQLGKEKYSEPLTQNSNIFSVGTGKNSLGQDVDIKSSIQDGQVNATVKGVTRTNLFKNDISDFVAGSNATISQDNGYFKVSTSIVGYVYSYQLVKVEPNKDYTIKVIAKSDGVANVRLRIDDVVAGTTLVNTDGNDLQTTDHEIELHFNSQTATEIKVFFYAFNGIGSAFYKDILLEQGTKAGNFITGTKSTVGVTRVKSVGKNLFDGKINERNDPMAKVTKINDKKFSVSCQHSLVTTYNVYNGKFKNNTVYTFSGSHIQDIDGKNSKLSIRYTDGTSKYFPNPSLAETNFLISSDTGKTVSHISLTFLTSGGVTTYDNFQIEENTTATTYEPYKESTTYINAGEPLRSLPNGVKDEVRATEGQKIKRVSDERILNGNNNWTYWDEFETTYRFRLRGEFQDAVMGQVDTAVGRSTDKTWGTTAGALSLDESLSFSLSDLRISIFKNRIDAIAGANTLEKFKNYLNQYPITLTYQFATPITTPIDVDGTLYAYPNGTIYIEPAIKFTKKPTSGSITIENAELPITSIESVKKIVVNEDGSRTYENVSTYTKTTTTIDGLDDNYFYEIVYFYPQELTTIPSTSMSYAINQKAQIMSNTASCQQNSKNINELDNFTTAYLLNLEMRVSLLESV